MTTTTGKKPFLSTKQRGQLRCSCSSLGFNSPSRCGCVYSKYADTFKALHNEGVGECIIALSTTTYKGETIINYALYSPNLSDILFKFSEDRDYHITAGGDVVSVYKSGNTEYTEKVIFCSVPYTKMAELKSVLDMSMVAKEFDWKGIRRLTHQLGVAVERILTLRGII